MQSCTRRSEKPIQYPVDVSDSFVSQTLLSGHLSGCKAGAPVPSLTAAGTWKGNARKGPSACELLASRKVPKARQETRHLLPLHSAFKAASPGPQCPNPHFLGFHSVLGVVPSLWIPQAATQKEVSVIIST